MGGAEGQTAEGREGQRERSGRQMRGGAKE